jgi:7-carboxy-7-deazaguanine synthase
MTASSLSRGLLVAEMFGPTFQGEGPSCGQPALFVRLSRCNLSCPGCDTPYTWDWRRYDPRVEARRLPAGEVLSWLLHRPARLVVITGGEPLLQQQLLLPVVEALADAGRRVEIETNGTIAPTTPLAAAVSAFNVSPKLAGFAAPADAARRINPAALQALAATGKAVFKFVVTGPADLAEIDHLQAELELDPVWVMPEGTATERVLAVMREVADDVLARGWHLTSRLHVLLWGDTRGR